LKNAEAVAAAIGLQLYDAKLRWKQRVAQLDTVRAAIARADFPQKKAKGFPRAEVMAWIAECVELHQGGRKFVIHDLPLRVADSKEQKASGDLPVQAVPAAVDLFEPASAQFEKTLDLWEDKLSNPEKWLATPIQLWQMRQLEKHRPHLFKNAAAPGVTDNETDEFQGGLEAVAAFIQLKFPGVNCNKMDISRWRHGKFLPDGCSEPFPPSHQSGRNSKKKIEAWVVRYLKTNATDQNIPGVVDNLDYERLQKKLNFERAQAEYEVWKQSESKKFMLVTDHESSLRNFGAIVWSRFCKVVERDLIHGLREKCKATLPPDLCEIVIADARARHDAAVDALQKEFAAMATE